MLVMPGLIGDFIGDFIDVSLDFSTPCFHNSFVFMTREVPLFPTSANPCRL